MYKIVGGIYLCFGEGNASFVSGCGFLEERQR